MDDQDSEVALARKVLLAALSNPAMSISELTDVVGLSLLLLRSLDKKPPPPKASGADLVVGQERLSCLECGRQFKSLKLHLSSVHGLTAQDYRNKWARLCPRRWCSWAGASRSRSALFIAP